MNGIEQLWQTLIPDTYMQEIHTTFTEGDVNVVEVDSNSSGY